MIQKSGDYHGKLDELLQQAISITTSYKDQESGDSWKLVDTYKHLKDIYALIYNELSNLQRHSVLKLRDIQKARSELAEADRKISQDPVLSNHKQRILRGFAYREDDMDHSHEVLDLYDEQHHDYQILRERLNNLQFDVEQKERDKKTNRFLLGSKFAYATCCTLMMASLALFSHKAFAKFTKPNISDYFKSKPPELSMPGKVSLKAKQDADRFKDYLTGYLNKKDFTGYLNAGETGDYLEDKIKEYLVTHSSDKTKHFNASQLMFLLGDKGITKYGTAQISAYQSLSVGMVKEAAIDMGLEGAWAFSYPTLSHQQMDAIISYYGAMPPKSNGVTNPVIQDISELVKLAVERDKIMSGEIKLGQAYMLGRSANSARQIILDTVGSNEMDGGQMKTQFGKMLFRFNRSQIELVEDALSFKGVKMERFESNPLYANLLKTEMKIKDLENHVLDYKLDVGDINANLLGILRTIDKHFEEQTMFAKDLGTRVDFLIKTFKYGPVFK